MPMPKDLVMVRHGQSEANIVQAALKEGDESLQTEEFLDRHDSLMRLSPRGVEQAVATGAWLLNEFGAQGFDRYTVSGHNRAMETAARLGLEPEDGWMIDDRLRERDWGHGGKMSHDARRERYPENAREHDQSAWYWASPGGESLASEVSMRFRGVLDTLHREMEEQRVLMVTHGEYIWVARFILERMTPAQFEEMDQDKTQRVQNTMVAHYTREDPFDSEAPLARRLSWMRFVCPWDESLSINEGEWMEIEFKKPGDEELLEMVEQTPRLFKK